MARPSSGSSGVSLVRGARTRRVTAAQEAGLIWTAARFNAFLADVQGAWPGNGMPVRGYDDPQLRADFILFFALEVEP